LRDALYDIYLYHSRRNTIRGNTVRGRRELEVGSRGAGLRLWNSPDLRRLRAESVRRKQLRRKSQPATADRKTQRHALAAAEQTFPIIKGSAEKDGAPLMKPIALHPPIEQSNSIALAQVLFATLSLTLAGTAIAVMWGRRMR